MQEINYKADTGDIEHSEAVYGKEQHNISGRYFSRDTSGFFYTQKGQRLCAYITLRRPDNLRVFDIYEKTLFINPRYNNKKNKLTELFDFDVIYDEKILPNN